ncbi:MAG: C10 family peptidase [Lentisphaeria bacterium]|jgi:hypothetical protein
MMKTLLTRLYCRGLSLAIVGLLFWAGQSSLQAAPVSLAAARAVAANWLAVAEKPMGADFTQAALAKVTPIVNAGGVTIAYHAALSPSGYIIVSADDRLQPIVTFSATGSYDDSAANPLRGLLLADLNARLAAVADIAPEGAATRSALPTAVQENKSAWEKFSAPRTRAAELDVVAEVWVDSLIKSRWSQGNGIYNYYTPRIYANSYSFNEHGNQENIVCGCVATANAQIMRYFQWPQKGIGSVQGSCSIIYADTNLAPNPVSVTKNLRGGNGVGGPYNWAAMALTPSSEADPVTFQQIGALCLDAGLSVNMEYDASKGESGANSSSGAYVSFFKYSGAAGAGGADGARANLDARRPLSSSTADATNPMGGGHAFVVDGYGRIDGRWFYHVNMGWAGSANGWYSFEEHLYAGSFLFNKAVGFGVGNIYRQPLQANEDVTSNGKIISGRITDANGKPVAGVKVSIRKAGDPEGSVWQRMLVWNEPIDPVATPIYKDWEGVLPGADKYRHWTDANGIWAIDKVVNGNYVIQLEKDGLEFAGETAVNVDANKWGLNFVASPLAKLELTSWWFEDLDGDTVNDCVYLRFNRAVGKVLVDPSKLTIGGTFLTGAVVYRAEACDTIILDIAGFATVPTGTLSMTADFLVIDVDGNDEYDGQGGINNVAAVNAVTPVNNVAAGTAPAPSSVQSIVRAGGAAFSVAAAEVEFEVSGSSLDAIGLNEFQVRVSSTYDGPEGTFAAKRAVLPPTATISSWDPVAGLLKVQVGKGDGYVRVDYIPAAAGQKPFLLGEAYHVDNVGPAIIKAELSTDNTYVTVTWNEPVGSLDDVTPLSLDNLPGMLCYTGTAGQADFAIWREARKPGNDLYDAEVGVEDVMFGCNGLMQGTAGYGLNIIQGYRTVTVPPFGDIEITIDLAQFMYVDLNENGRLDPDDMIFVKIRSDYESLSDATYAYNNRVTTDADYDAVFDPADTNDQRAILGPVKAPLPSGPVTAYRLKTTTFKYYNADGQLPKFDVSSGATGMFTEFKDWWNELSQPGNGGWVDYAPPQNDNFQSLEDTVLFGNAPADGASGTEIAASAYAGRIFYIDVVGNNILDNGDFAWLDHDTQGTSGEYDKDDDTVLGSVTAESFSWKAPISKDALQVLLHPNGGTVENVIADRITDESGKPSGVALAKMRVYLAYSPALENQSNVVANVTYDNATLAETAGVPAGLETIEIKPYADAVYDELANAASEGNSTGELLLYDSNRPRVKKVTLSYDNLSLMVQFNKRIYGNAQGILGNYLAGPMVAEKIEDKDNITEANVEVWAVYEDDSEVQLTVSNSGTNRDIVYQLGANYFEVRMYRTSANNISKLNVVGGYNGKKPVAIRIELAGIYDFDGRELVDTAISVPLHPVFTPGYSSLPPPMFTSAKGAYTQITLSAAQRELYVEYSDTSKLRLTDTLNPGVNPDQGEQGDDPDNNGAIQYYGVWYRDLDGDGRIDAVDLRFKNPYRENKNRRAELYYGSDARARFRVYVQNNDPEDFDDDEKKYYPPEKEGVNWANFPKWDQYPLGAEGYWGLFNQQLTAQWPDNFRANWRSVTVNSLEVIKPVVSGDNPPFSTLRLHLKQEEVSPRTHGDRLVMVMYAAPRRPVPKTGGAAVANSYDWRIVGDKAPLAKSADPPYNSSMTADEIARYDNADEEAGIYWRYDRSNLGSSRHAGHVDAYFIVDSFGPVVAWDGAPPRLTAAVAWRATPYPKKDEASLATAGYEYFDLTFSEPVAYAADTGLREPIEGSKAVSGYSDKATPSGYLYGAWGAEVIAPNIVRFKANGIWKSKRFSYNESILIEDSPGFHDQYCGWKREGSTTSILLDKLAKFSGTAIGVRPIDSRYRVMAQGENARVPMLAIEQDYATVSNTPYNMDKKQFGTPFTFDLSVNEVSLRAIAQGGGFTTTTARWHESSGWNANAVDSLKRQPGNVRTALEYSLYLNNNITNPGAGVYGAINAITIHNDTVAGFSGAGKNYALSQFATCHAPSPLDRGTGYSTALTPRRAIMSGPVYAMVKVSPAIQSAGVTPMSTAYANISSIAASRVVAGRAIPVLGIDAASSSSYTITAVTVRFVDTSHGQFDPEIDLMPLSDGATSGVVLYDENNEKVIEVANDGGEWSPWGITPEGLPYREVTLRPNAEVVLPTGGGAAQSFDFTIRVTASEAMNLADSFYVEIPDNGIAFGAYITQDQKPATWGTPNGGKGYPFTDFLHRDRNQDGRWAEGDAITSAEDVLYLTPLYDGGLPYFTAQKVKILAANGINVRNLYYAKKNGAANPESNPFYGHGGVTSATSSLTDLIGSGGVDLTYNVSYAPGDDIWYDIGGRPGVYDAGIDIPLFGNADNFVLPWSVAESGGRSAQLRAAAPAKAASAIEVSEGLRPVAAPSNGPVAMVGLDMQDAGRGFGPRYILNGAVLVETVSKNAAAGEHLITYQADVEMIAWNDGAARAIPAQIGGRAILADSRGSFIVVRRLADDHDSDGDGIVTEPAPLPDADVNIPVVVSADVDRDIQQPVVIRGVRIHAVGRGNVIASGLDNPTPRTLTRSNSGGTSTLSWAGGAPVDVSAGGLFVLNPGADNYLLVEVSALGAAAGGAASECLNIYPADGRAIAPLFNISGLEIMAVSDMSPFGFHTFSYDGAGALSWGSGSPEDVRGAPGSLTLVYGDGAHTDYPRNYVVVRRTAAPLPAAAVTDTVFINQTQLLKVFVTIQNISGFSSTHIMPLDKSENSGVSLWWDANADGQFNQGDMFVKLLEEPVLQGSAGKYTCTLIPDPAWLTAWLSCPQDSSYSTRGSNFFVCVNTTVDMSYGDKFRVSADFYEPSEPNYETGGYCFARGSSGEVTCTSITNTVYAKLTHNGQTVDAGATVGLASIDHFLGTDLERPVYMTEVKVRIHGVTNFDPDEVFTAMDAEDEAKRGILLYADTNNNGVFNPGSDRVIPCYINIDQSVPGQWTYTLIPETTGDDSKVPGTNDGRPDHFVAVNLSEKLPFGVSFYATMAKDAVTYNTSPGNSASALRTDTLTSTIASKYQDLLGSSMVTATTGLSVNAVGAQVASAYHKVTFAYNPNNNQYTLSWNNNVPVIINVDEVGTYPIGDEGTGKYIKVTFDPAAFFREDTLVCSPTGLPPQINDATGQFLRPAIKLGDRLTSLAGQPGLFYYDANVNGRYDHGETIAAMTPADGKRLIYGQGAEIALAVTPFSPADGLAFFSADGSDVFALTYDPADGDVIRDYDAIFHDSDGVYTLPWMARTADVDNYVTAGQGGAPGISSDATLVNAALASLPGGETLADLVDDFATTSPLFLYYIDTVQDGLGYRHGEDIIIARQHSGAVTAPLTFASTTDKVVYDPAYVALEDKSAYAQPADGTALVQFREMDYVRYKEHAAGGNNFAQGQALFLSYNASYKAPAFDWTIRVDKDRTIRRYNPQAMKPFDTARSAMTAVVGLDIANSGAADVKLTSLTVRFRNVANFSTTDLRPLTNTEDSGVQLWRDVDGNGIFNPSIDARVTLSAAPAWQNDGTNNFLTFSPEQGNTISNLKVDGLYDFFVIVQPSESANGKQLLDKDKGDQFKIEIKNSDVVLNKTLNKTAAITTGTITIDSKPPEQTAAAAIVDSDQDGYLERVVLTFHEELRPGMLTDLDIWQLEDAATGVPVTVTDATLSDDYKTVTLTLAGNDLGSTSGPLRLKVAYADDASAALLDWAGNPAEFRLNSTILEADSFITNYVQTADAVVPRIVHSGLPHSIAGYDAATATAAAGMFFFRDRNDDGVWNPGENIWQGAATFAAATCRKVWNGGDADTPAAWNTPDGYVGEALANAFFCDANNNGDWDANEFLWLDRSDPADPAAYGVYDAAVDQAVPLNRTEEIAVLDTDADGRLDALRVLFSEMMKDETIDGYKADLDSFTANKWSLAGRGTLTAWRQGLGAAYGDALNNNQLYFSFPPSTTPDTGVIPALAVASGETLADQAGNRLNAGAAYAPANLVLSDQAPPILLDVVSSNKVTKVAGTNYALAAGSTLTLTFSEPIVQYLHLNPGATIADLTDGFHYTVNNGADGWPALAGKLPAGSTVEVDENTIVITFAAETDGWPQTGVQFRLAVDPLADSVYGDAVGHNPLSADFAVPSLDAPDPTRFEQPLAGDYIRAANDGLAVWVHWGDNPADAGQPWTLSVFAGHTYDPTAPLETATGTDPALLTKPEAVVDLADWAIQGQYAYTVVLTYQSGGVAKTVKTAFFYAATNDVEEFANFVNDGASPGEDADQIHCGDGKLAANWPDFAAANGRPAAARYRYAFAVQGLEPTTYSPLTPNRFGEVAVDLSGDVGVTYVAFVEAFDANDTLIARATSDGAEVVTVLSDKLAPTIALGFPKDGAELGEDIDESTSLTSLGFNFRASDNQAADTGIAKYDYRLVRGVESAVWSADNANKQLDSGRTGYAAVTVDNQAWIIGGYNGTQALSTINYTPLNQDGVWSSREWATLTTGSLNTPRADFAFAKLANGDLVAAGGSDGYHNYYKSVELFSMATKTWSTLTVSLPEPRVNAQAVAVDDNRVWIIGGRNNTDGVLSSIVEIDLSDRNNPVVTPLAAAMSASRSYFQTALQTRADGKKVVLVIGGKTGAGAGTVVYPVIDVFSVETGARSTVELTTGRFLSAVVSVPLAGSTVNANDIWVLGGFGADLACLKSVDCISAANGAVVALSDMNSPRAEFAAAWLAESEAVIAVGGLCDDDDSVTDSTEVAPRDGSRWDLATSLTKTSGLVGHSLAVAGAGDQARLVAFGGRDGSYQYLKATESRRVIEVALPWTTVTVDPPQTELAVSRNLTGLSLVDGATYSFQVRVTDAAGNTSLIAGSDGVLVDTTLTRATITCAAIPAPVGAVPGQTAENVYSVTVGGNGVQSYKYRLTKDGTAVSDWSAVWTAVATPIALTLPELGDYELSVIGRGVSGEQRPGSATTAGWTIVQPRAVVVAGLPVAGGKSYDASPVVTIGGAGVRRYEYALDSFADAAWSAPIPVGTPITLSNLLPGDHILYLRGYSFSNDQTRAHRTSHAWTVLAQGLILDFTPSLPPSMTTPVTAGTQFNVAVQDPAMPDDPAADDIESYFYELWRDGQLLVANGSEATPIPQATPIALTGLTPGDYLLKVKGYAIAADAWQDLFTEQEFTVATLGAPTFTPDLAMSSVDSYQVTVDLNGLTNYKYKLLRKTAGGDVDAIPETPVTIIGAADLTFTVGPLEAGVYTLQLWGGDGSANIYQPTPLETEITVTRETPVGPILSADLAAPAASAPLAAGDIDLTLTFPAKLMAPPTPADFIVSGVLVTAVTPVNDLEYTVTLTPSFPADVNQVKATVRLAANKVYGYYSGNGNAASNTVSVLIYRDPVIALTLTAEAVDENDAPTGELLPAEGVDISERFAVKVLIQAEDACKGGDFVLKFDADKFRLVGPLQENGTPDAQGNIPVDGEAAIADDFNALATIADYVYDAADRIVGLRLAGTAAPGVDIRTPTLYATLVFQAIGVAGGADSDFFVEKGTSGLLLDTYGLVGPAGDAVAFGVRQVPVAFLANGLAIAFDPANVPEGGNSTMTLSLDYELDYDLVVTINGDDYTIPKGETSASFADIPAAGDDQKLTGDRGTVFTATAVNNATHVTSLDGVSATLLALDDEAEGIRFKITDPVSGDEIASIPENGQFRLTAALGVGVTAAADAKFALTFGGTAAAGADYAIGGNLIIANGANKGSIDITSYPDGVADEGKTITIQVTGLTIGAAGAAANFVAPPVMTVQVTNIDKVPGDITGEDGESDGVVDLVDLLFFLNHWMADATDPDTNYDASCDFNHDGKIDLDDLLVLLNNWTDNGNGTRSGAAAPARRGTQADVTIRLQEKNGKTSVALNDTVTIQAFVSTDWPGGLAGGRVDVNYTPDVLSFHGSFNHAEVVKNFTMVTQGSLDNANGVIDDVGGANLAGLAYNTDVLFLEFTLDAATLGAGTATVSFGDDFIFSTLSGGPTTSAGTLGVIVANSLTFNVIDDSTRSPQPEFALAFERAYTAGTRASAEAELILGMAVGAVFAGTDALDSPAGPAFPGVYYVAFDEEGRDEPLKWDFRGLSDAEVWNVVGTLPAGASLKLDWSLSLSGTDPDYSMPDYFDFFITFPEGGEIDMRAAANKYIEFTNPGATTMNFAFAVEVVKHIDLVSHTYQLHGGWNLIGVPFALDEDSQGLLVTLDPMGYDPATAAYVEDVNQFIPGKAYWVNVPAGLLTAGVYNMTLRGTEVGDSAVPVSVGWNLVSPLYRSDLVNNGNPTSNLIPTVWYWEPGGYLWLLPDKNAKVGVGYWLNSSVDGEIWPQTTAQP